MAILTTQGVGQSFGAFDVFKNISVSIEEDAKIGLVGPNGIGKTTFLLILSSLARPTVGSVRHAPELRIGYLRQEAMDAFAQRENTVYGEMLTLFAGIQEKEARMRELEHAMAEDYHDGVAEEYAALHDEFERIGGYDYEVRIRQTLDGLGFKPQHYDTPLHQLSGGQKTRALLARLLLERPELLILDEPTNHLDVEAVEWLETTLKAWKGALLIVSHDRYFLDTVVNTTWEMTREGIEVYRGNYSAYARQRSERWEYAEKVYETERQRLLSELDFIKKNIVRASSNPRAVGSLRMLSRDLVAIEEMGIMNYKQSKQWSQTGVGAVRPLTVAEAEAAIKRLASPNLRPPRLGIRLKSTYRSGDLVLRTKHLEIGYPDNSLFFADDITLRRGEVAAMIGRNGTGKTTFLKTLMGSLQPLSGFITPGAGLKVGYFAQVHDTLNPDNTVLDELLAHKYMLVSEARHHLAAYLFRSDDVYKKVSMLSGGERARLALSILALEGANFLLMDEPTNHLDIMAQEILQEIMEGFEGTILLVSHDRYLIDRLASQIWNLEDGYLSVFEGSYQEYLAARDVQRAAARTAQQAAKQAARRGDPRPARSNGKKTDPAVARLETQISTLEADLRELERILERASQAKNVDDVRRLSDQYAASQAQLEGLMARWAELAE